MNLSDKNINNGTTSLNHTFLINTPFMLLSVKDELQTIVADWYSMSRVTTQTRDLVLATSDQALDFLLKLRKFGRVFEKFSRVF